VLTKLDGDARGGAALSLRASLGVPIKFIGVGERLEALEPFHPDRLAARILDLGDVATLLERVQQGLPATPPAKGAEERFTFEDLLEQLRALQRMGPLSELLRLLPGGGALAKTLPVDERALRRAEAIILSMTPEERRNPRILNASRRRRIARGSGTSVQEVNRLVASLEQMQQLLKLWKRGRLPLPLQQLFRQ
jgi:signal recognition particle subunit SRP54